MTAQQEAPTIWAVRAQPGDRVVYHEGDLASDRHHKDIAHLADEWLRLSNQGVVVLLQKRIEIGRYKYLAVRSAKPASAADQIKEIMASGRALIETPAAGLDC